MSDESHLLCLGMGYTAQALASRLQGAGWPVTGTCRTEQRRRELADAGYCTYVDSGGTAPAVPGETIAGVTHVLSSVPPGPEGDPLLPRYAEALRRSERLRWIGYLSATSVYGDRDGAWVDEASDCHPTGDRGRRRLAAEQDWLRLWHDSGLPVHIFRLAAIYGPGRSALERARAAEARRIRKPGHVFSRAHVDDIARVLAASMAHPHPGSIYNVADDEPADSADVTAYACELLGIDTPPLESLEDADLSAGARSFYADNKRVDNRRIKEELGVRLAYPSYREGLAAIARQRKAAQG